MEDEKMPWFKFYGGDWRKNPELRSCSYAARGLWVDLLTLMHESPRRGYLLIGGNPPSCRDLAAVLGGSWRTLEALLKELRERQVISVEVNGDDARSHVYYSGRMAKDAEIQRKQAEYGRRGGSPSLKATLNPTLKAPLKDTLKPRVRGQSQRSESDIIDTNVSIPASANAEPHPSSSVVKKPARRPREPDAVWDVVAELYFGSNVVLDSQKKKCGMIVRDLKKLGATPDEIRRRKANIPESWTLPGPGALIAHWSELDKRPASGTMPPPPEPYNLKKTLEQAYVNRDKLLGVR